MSLVDSRGGSTAHFNGYDAAIMSIEDSLDHRREVMSSESQSTEYGRRIARGANSTVRSP